MANGENGQLSAFIVLANGIDGSLLEMAIPPGGSFTVAGISEDHDGGDRAMQDSAADILVVASSGAPEAAVDVIRRSAVERPERPVVALCEGPPTYFVQAAFDAGAEDVVKLPETPERVTFALEKAVARHRSRDVEGRGHLAPMVCVLGPKGGTGKTVTSVNLAVSIAQAGKRPVLVDLDLQFGDVGLALGLDPRRTVYDLATSGGALDAEKLDAYLATHSTGARALLAPVRPDQASAISSQFMREVYPLLRATHDIVVVDTPPDFTPEVISAIDVASHICMIANMDSLSVKNTKLGLDTLELMGVDREAVTVVLNRADSKVGLTPADVEEIIGRKPNVLVPSDRDVPRSLNEGSPIVLSQPRSVVAAALRELPRFYVANGGNGKPASNGKGRRRLRLRRRRRS